MTDSPSTAQATPLRLWSARVLTAVALLGLAGSAYGKLSAQPQMVEMFHKMGFADGALRQFGGLELACAIVYAIPQTAVLGAVLLTGYFGGAIATHVKLGEPFTAPLLIGVLVWGALWLREPRLQALLPLRKR
jgi:hypothetical protein